MEALMMHTYCCNWLVHHLLFFLYYWSKELEEASRDPYDWLDSLDLQKEDFESEEQSLLLSLEESRREEEEWTYFGKKWRWLFHPDQKCVSSGMRMPYMQRELRQLLLSKGLWFENHLDFEWLKLRRDLYSTTPVVMEDFRCCPAATTGSRGGDGGADEQGVEDPLKSFSRWYIA